MKIVVVILIIIISYMIGVYIVRKSRVHLATLSDILNLIECLKIEINYSNEKIHTIICSFLKKCKTQLKNIQNKEKISILYQNERDDLEKMIASLGLSDICGQNALLDKYKILFNKYLSDAITKHENLSKTAVKISLAVGLLISILIL